MIMARDRATDTSRRPLPCCRDFPDCLLILARHFAKFTRGGPETLLLILAYGDAMRLVLITLSVEISLQ